MGCAVLRLLYVLSQVVDRDNLGVRHLVGDQQQGITDTPREVDIFDLGQTASPQDGDAIRVERKQQLS